MNYLNQVTLKVLLYLLYGNGYIEIPTTLRIEKENLIKDIFENKLDKIFILEKNGEIFQGADYKKLLSTDFVDFSLINKPLRIKLIAEKKDELLNFLSEYINNFESDNLKTGKDNYYLFKINVSEVKKTLGSLNSIKIPLKDDTQNSPYGKEVRFFETLFYFLKIEYISLDSCRINKILDFQAKEEQIIDLILTINKDVNLTVIDKAGALEENKDQKQEVSYKLSFSTFTGEIFINGKKLKSPHYDSTNRIVFGYLYKHPDEDVELETLKEEVSHELDKTFKKPLSKIAQELGFVGDRKKLFFITTKNTARLRIKVTKEQVDEANIDISKILP